MEIRELALESRDPGSPLLCFRLIGLRANFLALTLALPRVQIHNQGKTVKQLPYIHLLLILLMKGNDSEYCGLACLCFSRFLANVCSAVMALVPPEKLLRETTCERPYFRLAASKSLLADT